MLEINLWYHTSGKSKGAIKGPLISSLGSGNVGHINMVVTISEHQQESLQLKSLAQLQQDFADLGPKLINTITRKKTSPELDPELEVLNKLCDEIYHQTGYVKNKYQTQNAKALEFVQSFWPKNRPGRVKQLMGLLGFNVPGEFRTLQDDMILEAECITIYGKKILPKSQHFNAGIQTKQTLKALKKEQDILDKTIENIATELDLQLSKENELEGQLNKLEKLKSSVSHKLKEAKKNIRKADKDQSEFKDSLLQLAYLYKSTVILEIHQNNMAIDELENQLIDTKSNLVLLKQECIDTKKEFSDLEEKQAALEKQFTNEVSITGKSPDHTITLNLESGPGFYRLNEENILEAMLKRRSTPNFSIGKVNCAYVTKECIRKGITPQLKQKLKESGLPEKFFTVGRGTTPAGLFNWINKLNEHMVKINYPNQPAQNHGLSVKL